MCDGPLMKACRDCGISISRKATRCRRCNLVWRNTVDHDQQYLLSRVEVDAESGCWLWTGPRSRLGYPTLKVGDEHGAHRLAYRLWKGSIPDGLTIDHLCRVRHCVNPEHLEPVTQRVNSIRGTSPFAVNAQKTHCKHGHEFTPENTMRSPSLNGRRRCRACYNALRRRRRAPA